MAGTLTPSPIQTVLDSNGNPVSGAQVFTYISGTTTKLSTYTTSTLGVANANPIVCNSAGRYTAFLGPYTYTFVAAPANDTDPPQNAYWTANGISAVPSTNVDLDIIGTAGQDLAMNDCVILSDGSGGNTAGRWYKADADTNYLSSTSKQHGFAPAAILTSASGSIRLQGRVTGLSALTAGTTYYASATAGAITSTPPTLSLAVGVADSTTSLLIPAQISDASATVSGIVNLTTQSFAGAKTFTGAMVAASTLNVQGALDCDTTLNVDSTSQFVGQVQCTIPPKFQPGTSTGTYAPASGVLFTDITARSNSGTGDTDLSTTTMPANVLSADGKTIRVTAWGQNAAAATTKTIRLWFGGTEIFRFVMSPDGRMWRLQGYIMRTGASTETSTVTYHGNNMAVNTLPAAGTIVGPITTVFDNLAIATSGTIIVKTTGQSSSASNEVTQNGFILEVVG